MNNNSLDPTLVLTEKLIHENQLPELIGPVKWKDLARVLGFSETNIDEIQIEKECCPKECCIAVLVRWIRRKGREATVAELAEALIKIELKSVADILLGEYNTFNHFTYCSVCLKIQYRNASRQFLGYPAVFRAYIFVK